ncbi:hypothetical protein AYI69_g10608 [Smittium culicis]|uniref:CCHC-type domain-containing protein n=1 Tax=Smittium culicis TaxID=133412 RepID=A0A1R1X4K7_9FUNG|nr:hypothetical protein AYI69_g10608 [Smittium culicis]
MFKLKVSPAKFHGSSSDVMSIRNGRNYVYQRIVKKKTCVDILSKIDNNIWWNLAQSVSNDSIEELMKKSIQLSEIKIAANIKEPEVEEVKLKPEDKTVMKSTDKKIDDLITAFGKMELLVQNSKPTNNPMSYTCYTCGEKGHTSKYCRNGMTKERRKSSTHVSNKFGSSFAYIFHCKDWSQKTSGKQFTKLARG